MIPARVESWYLTELTSALDKLVRAMYPCTRGLWRSLRHSKPPPSLYLFLQQKLSSAPRPELPAVDSLPASSGFKHAKREAAMHFNLDEDSRLVACKTQTKHHRTAPLKHSRDDTSSKLSRATNCTNL
ncbi:hypothetical protein H0G86_008434 [Trichoderma simmonsii]|uniref:Uncharacterized protein n=1 Tax=Trichoderma simmonsii TaxID=1491479 RepID=A0A8G0LFK0_9HYPO|nr:hypothetical protein H0G86_008434 [Trichoderma simmonsii]